MNRPAQAIVRVLSLVIPLWLGVPACGGDSQSEPDTIVCQIDPTQLAEERSCTVDDQCPCGSACSFGRCDTECTEDAECPDRQSCDTFGRCQDEGNTSTVRILRAEKAPDVRLSTNVLIFANASEDAQVLGLAHDREQELELRIEGQRVLVSCDEGQSFSSSCQALFAANTDSPIYVRPSPDATQQNGAIVIHPERGRTSLVSVQVGSDILLTTARLSKKLSGNRQLREWGPLANGAVFRGQAIFQAVGADGKGELPVNGLPTLPIEVELFPGSGEQVLLFREPIAALHPEGGFLATLTNGAINIPAWRHIAAAELNIPEAEVVVQPRVFNVRAEPGLLAFEVEIFYGGFSVNRPYYRLLFDLQRVGDAPAGQGPFVGPSYTSIFAQSRANVATPWEARANAVCGGACDVAQISRFACNDDFSTSQNFDDSGQGLVLSGDLRCTGQRAFAPDYLLAIERGTSSFSRFELVEQCRDDLQNFTLAPNGDASDLNARECIHPLRWYGGIASTIEQVRGNASPPALEATLALRNAQQLIESAGFVALESVQATRYNLALSGDCGSATCPDLEAMSIYVQASQSVIDPFLHPRYGQYLEALASVQTEVDYSGQLGTGRYDGPTLAYSMLRSSVAQLELLRVATEADHFAGVSVPVDGYASIALRKTLLLRAYAGALAVQSNGGSGLDETDAGDFSTQADLFAEAFISVSSRIAAIRLGTNPLGISEDSVPLYLNRDVENPEARAFALTNYLLDPMGSGWISQAIDSAADAQRDARTAWSDRIAADLVGLQLDNDNALYLDAVARDYGQRIAALCPAVDAGGSLIADSEILSRLAAGSLTLNADDCFLAKNNPQCSEFATPRGYTVREAATDLCVAAILRRNSTQAGFPQGGNADDFIEFESTRLHSGGSLWKTARAPWRFQY